MPFLVFFSPKPMFTNLKFLVFIITQPCTFNRPGQEMCKWLNQLLPKGKVAFTPYEDYKKQARFACLRCAAGRHFVSAGGSLRSPGVILVNYKRDNISKYVCPNVIIYIARKITKFTNL